MTLSVSSDFPRCASKLREDLTLRQCQQSTRGLQQHIMVFMISAEDRAQKPYALPIQCVPYTGMNESNARLLVKEIYDKTWINSSRYTNQNKCIDIGFVSNGEFNYFRIQ